MSITVLWSYAQCYSYRKHTYEEKYTLLKNIISLDRLDIQSWNYILALIDILSFVFFIQVVDCFLACESLHVWLPSMLQRWWQNLGLHMKKNRESQACKHHFASMQSRMVILHSSPPLTVFTSLSMQRTAMEHQALRLRSIVPTLYIGH